MSSTADPPGSSPSAATTGSTSSADLSSDTPAASVTHPESSKSTPGLDQTTQTEYPKVPKVRIVIGILNWGDAANPWERKPNKEKKRYQQ